MDLSFAVYRPEARVYKVVSPHGLLCVCSLSLLRVGRGIDRNSSGPLDGIDMWDVDDYLRSLVSLPIQRPKADNELRPTTDKISLPYPHANL